MGVRTLPLPRLVAGRDYADDMVKALGAVGGQDVVVDATRLLSGTTSFAYQLIERLLADENASSVLLVGAPADFAEYATSAARELHVTDRFDLAEELPRTAAAS
ncbi:MAG: hypothetical protein ABI047_10755 [Jatrophihabitantaceae bacterium]